jgi:2-amino-4-hydroxy-6-hydroxymethyldihydropteridine diphosphokinase
MIASAARADSPSASTVYIGIGSNLGRPREQVSDAVRALGELAETRLLAISPLYRNPAVGPGTQPDYVNAVAAMETRLAPHTLLDCLLGIEAGHGRLRGTERWQARTLDLDLLLYGNRVIDDARLSVPHPHLQERAFVLKPLFDIAPHLEIPKLGSLAALLERVSTASLVRLDSRETSP